MSDRLKGLLADIREALEDDGRALVVSGRIEEALAAWAGSLEAEIAEREAPPPVLEGALARIERAIYEEIDLLQGSRRFPDTRTDRFLVALRNEIRALALRGARPATRAEWLAIAADLAQDEGEVNEGLARAVASLLPRLVEHESVRGALVKRVVGPWSFVRTEDPYEDWRRHSADGDCVADVAESEGQEGVFWRVWDRNRLVTHGHAPTIRDALLAADAALRAEGRILLGGLPPEVEQQGRGGEIVPQDAIPAGRVVQVVEGGGASGRPRRVIEDEPGEELDIEEAAWWARTSGGGDEESVTPPEEAQPDASWLRLEGRFHADMWTYRGDAPQQDADITGADAFDVLIAWLNRRGLLVDWRAYTLPGRRLGYVEIRTRAPLVGARGGDRAGATPPEVEP